MRLRRFITLTVFISFVFLALTGVMLFLSPQGRIAHWSGWQMLGLSREQYVALHTTFMVLFLVVGIWHIVYNWKPIVTYLKSRSKNVRVLTLESWSALALGVVILAGTLVGAPPFQQFLGIGESIKAFWEVKHGSPPWGHAELNSLGRFCRGMEDFERLEHQRLVTIDCNEAISALRTAGVNVVSDSQQLIDIADVNGTTPQALAAIVLSVARPHDPTVADTVTQGRPLFPMPYSGLGRMTLRQYAEQYDADLELALSLLRERGIELDPDARLREATTGLDTDPEGLIALLNAAATAHQ